MPGRKKEVSVLVKLKEVLNVLSQGEAKEIGKHYMQGNEKAGRVIVCYVEYLRHPKDLHRIKGLRRSYKAYKRSLEGK